MRDLSLGIALCLATLACSNTKPCRPGTVTIGVDFADPASVVDGVALRYQLDGGPLTELQPAARPGGAAHGTVVLAVKGYTSHRELLVQFAARKADVVVGAWQERQIPLADGCTAISIRVGIGLDGGPTDSAPPVDGSLIVDAHFASERFQAADGGEPPADGHLASDDGASAVEVGRSDGPARTGDAGEDVSVADVTSESFSSPDVPLTGDADWGGDGAGGIQGTGGGSGGGGASGEGGTAGGGGVPGLDSGGEAANPCVGTTPPNYGVACGSCGGTIQCDGECGVPTPPDFGKVCGTCGGTVMCDGTCSVLTPRNYGTPCGSCGGIVSCAGVCSPATPTNYGTACGKCGGTIKCDGTCSIATPTAWGTSCSGTFDCGAYGWYGCYMPSSGTIQCNGSCGNISGDDASCYNYCF